MIYLLVFFTSFIVTIILTPLLLYIIENKFQILTNSNTSSEKNYSFSLGGIIVFLSLIITLNAFTQNFDSIKSLIIASAILVFSGIIDDYIGIKKILRFALQNITTIIFILFLQNYYEAIEIFGFTLSAPYSYFVLIIFVTAIINAFNLMNRLEGLASGFSIIIFSYLFILSIINNDVYMMKMNLIMLGTALGFIRYNIFPSKLNLGVTGSMMIGLFIIFSSFKLSINPETKILDLTFPLLLLGIPIVYLIKFIILIISNRYEKYRTDLQDTKNIITGGLTKKSGTLFLIEIFTLIFILISLVYYQNHPFYPIPIYFFVLIFIVGLKTFLSKIDFANKLNAISRYIHFSSYKKLTRLKNIVLILAALIILSILVLSYPTETTLTHKELFFLLGGVFALLFIEFFQIKNKSTFNDIAIFLNITIFFVLARLSLFSLESLDVDLSFYHFYHDVAFYALSIITVIAVIVRWQLEMSNDLLFTGTDLTLIIVMFLLFILNKTIKFDVNYYLSFSLLEAFIFYIWIKLILATNQKLKIPAIILSFFIPIVSIITLIIF